MSDVVTVAKIPSMIRGDLREVVRYSLVPGSTVRSVIGPFARELTAQGYADFVVMRNGHPVEDLDAPVAPGDFLSISVKHGELITGLIWIALMNVGMYGMALHVAAYVLTGALLVGAGLLVNTFLGAPKPSDAAKLNDSPSYGFSGTNPTQAGYPVPVVYGHVATTPPVLASYRTVDATDYSMWQWLLFAATVGPTNNALTASDVLVGDEELDTLESYGFSATDGSTAPALAELAWFTQIRHDRVSTRNLSYNYEFNLDTLGSCDSVHLIVECPNGIFRVDSEGNVQNMTVVLEVSYALQGESRASMVAAQGTITLTGIPTAGFDTLTIDTVTWTFVELRGNAGEITVGLDADATAGNIVTAITADATTVTAARGTGNTVVVTAATAGSAGNSLVFTESADNLAVNGSGTLGGTTAGSDGAYVDWTLTEDRTAAVRFSYDLTFPARGKYTVYLRRKTADDPESDSKQRSTTSLISFQEILGIQQSYPGIQAVGVALKADQNLSGQIPAIQIIQERTSLSVPSWDNLTTMTVNPSNPAWAAYAAMTDGYTGRKISPLQLVQSAWEDWEDWCDGLVEGNKRAQCNIVFDERGNFGDHCLAYIEAVGRAKIIQYGDLWTVVVDKPRTPSYSFSSGNIIAGSFGWESYEDAEKVDAVEIVYWDKDKRFRERRVLAKASWYEALTTQPRVASIELRGCNNADQATREAIFRVQKTEMVTRHGSLEVLPQGIFIERGDVVEIIHPTNQQGFGGRLARDHTAASTIYLDQLVTLPAATYSGKAKLYVIDPDGTRFELTVTGPWDTETQTITIAETYTGYRFDCFAIGRPNDEKLQYQVCNRKVVPASQDKAERIAIEFCEYVDAMFYHADYGSGAVAI